MKTDDVVTKELIKLDERLHEARRAEAILRGALDKVLSDIAYLEQERFLVQNKFFKTVQINEESE